MRKLFLFIVFFPSLLFGQTKWYANNGAQTGTGTSSDPFGYQYAFSLADGKISGGDTVILNPGNYNPIIYSSKADDWVTFHGKGAVFVSGEDDTNKKGIIEVDGGEYVRFFNLVIKGTNPNRDKRLDTWKGAASGFQLVSGSFIDIVSCNISNVTGSGIYKAAGAQNVRLLYNLVKYVGYMDFDRGHSHPFYIQNSDGSYCIIQGNIAGHSLSFVTQVWQQSDMFKQESRLIDVQLIDNVFFHAVDRPLHYGGNNFSSGAVIKGNSIFNYNSQGISVGYTTTTINPNHLATVDNNYIQNAKLSLLNLSESTISVKGNTIVEDGEIILIGSNGERKFDTYKTVLTGNKYFNNTTKSFRYFVDEYNPETNMSDRKFNVTYDFDSWQGIGADLESTKSPFSNASNFQKIIQDPYSRRIFVAVHNNQNLDEVKLSIDKFIASGDQIDVYDFEYSDSVYKGAYDQIMVNMNNEKIDPIFGNLEQPQKTSNEFGVFIIENVPDSGGKPPIDPEPGDSIIFELPHYNFDSAFQAIDSRLIYLEDLMLELKQEIRINRDSIKDHEVKIKVE